MNGFFEFLAASARRRWGRGTPRRKGEVHRKNTTRCLAGMLAVAAVHCLPATANAAIVATANVPGNLTFNVASSPLGNIAGCTMVRGLHSYGTASARTTSATFYSFTGTAQTGTTDSFLALYKNSFDPANPTANLVGCNDDGGGSSRLPRFAAFLEADTTYVMVATTYNADPFFTGSVTFSIDMEPSMSMDAMSAAVGTTGRVMVATSDSPMPISYESSNPAVAIIDPATGALTLLAPGSSAITASQAAQPDPLPFAEGKTTAVLTVTAAPAPNLFLAPMSVAVGATGQAMVATSDSSMPFSYSSSDPGVATVDPATGALTLLAEGIVTITASQAALIGPDPFGEGSTSALLTVTATPVPEILLEPMSAAVGATGHAMVAISDSSMPISYASSDTDVATIDPATGALTLLSVGTSTITASQAAQGGPSPFTEGTATALLTVTAAPVPPAPQPIPTLSQWGVVLMASLLALFGLVGLRRRN